MGLKKFAREYLDFGRRDRLAVLTIFFFVLGAYFLPEFIPRARFSQAQPDSATIKALERMELEENSKNRVGSDEESSYGSYADRYDRPANSKYQKAKGELFNFDPNTLSVADWKRLGLRDKTIGTIQNYLAKGGQFRKAEDLKKVYGLFPDEFERLEPFIQIGNKQYSIGKRHYTIGNGQDEENGFPEKKTVAGKKDLVVPDINSADTTQLIALPGIGSKLAFRIINFRDKLGGFYSIEQVGETFGLADSTFQKIKQYLKIGNTPVNKININTVTAELLKAHPYIRYAIAGPIIAYRKEHGPFKKIEDLKNVMAVTEEVFKKIENYLMIE